MYWLLFRPCIFSLVIPRVIRAYGGLVLNDIKRLITSSVDSEKFSPQGFLRVRRQVCVDDVTRLFFPPPTQKMSLARETKVATRGKIE